ncbi:MFS general substrate transporter [Neolentinus lepideus HHB14362 ss-1]|uniref:MFS general substrate transporter n=1 Tax=Neolentinus lepideus HHB14362 ss-1 TaxID=1314782 RepID=A0A165QUJ2_9AGAM|nr:MFS general substrate transporter [Neolentinus lepideus HHB14362 ss-1]
MVGFASLPAAEVRGEGDSRLVGVSKILGPKWVQSPVLTVGLLGVQVLWSVEMSYASPYLLSLGLQKPLMAVVFLAGPLSGLIVQPLIGTLTDRSRSRLGRRRPYILAGIVVCVFGVMLLGFTRQFASIFTASNSYANDVLTIWLAIWAIYCIDFAVNAGKFSPSLDIFFASDRAAYIVQAVDRALIVDTLPTDEQASGNAWAARMLGIGSVAGFFVGNIDLTQVFVVFGNTELQALAVIASLLLVATHSVTVYCVKEKIFVDSSKNTGKGLRAEMKILWHNILKLPRVIRQICIIQFFAWLGWFPILFYTTVYIGELHMRASPTPVDDDAAAALDAEGTRLGTRAMLYNAIVSLVTTFVMPLFVAREDARHEARDALLSVKGRKSKWKMHLSTLWAASHLLFTICMTATWFTSSVSGATVLMAMVGFSWAITQWAPFSLLGEAIHSASSSVGEDAASIRLSDTRSETVPRRTNRRQDDEERQFLVVDEDDMLDSSSDGVASTRTSLSIDGGNENVEPRAAMLMQHAEARVSRPNIGTTSDNAVNGGSEDMHTLEKDDDLSSKAGVILGIHNIFIVIPQFLVTGLSSIIFAIFEPSKSVLHGHSPGNTSPKSGNLTVLGIEDNNDTSNVMLLRRLGDNVDVSGGPNSVAIIFRLGGVAAAVAFILCCRLSRDMRRRS